MPTKIQVVETGICPDTFDDTELPTDVHIITFTKDGERQFDAVRAYSKADIFDEYYDKLGKDNPIHSIVKLVACRLWLVACRLWLGALHGTGC